MGKASKWFRGLLGLKKTESTGTTPSQTPAREATRSRSKPPKKKWSFGKSHRETENQSLKPNGTDSYGVAAAPTQTSDEAYMEDPEKHAIAVAAATAAVAEAAVAAAQAAASVVRLTSSGRSTANTSGVLNPAAYVSSGSFGIREGWAAVTIQSHFRAYLARRALRALKALVRLQALVRGHIVRKRTADMLSRRVQALLRAQSRARAGRVQISESPYSSIKSGQSHHLGPATPEKFEHAIRANATKHGQSLMLKRNGSKSNERIIIHQDKAHVGWNPLDGRMDEGSLERGSFVRMGKTDDERSDKILEIDTGKPQFTPKRRSLFQPSHLSLGSDLNSHSFTTSKDSTARQTVPSPSSCEVQSFSLSEFTQDIEETSFCTATNSPQYYSASSNGGSSRRGPFTPTKSDSSRSRLSGYWDNPNYMAYTESSKAKMRSISAPKQRPQFERSGSTKRSSVHGHGDLRSSHQQVSALHANFTNKAYPGSGRLDRLGMPVRGDAAFFSGGHWNRY